MKSLGKFGKFGGVFVPELLMPALQELEKGFLEFKDDSMFKRELKILLRDYAGRPTPLYLAQNFSKKIGCKVYLKREDLLHGGAHKTNNTLGQGLLAKFMGKEKLIAETGAGQHGLATAIIGALFGMQVKIFMGQKDVLRQSPNVLRMKMCGAEVIPVGRGGKGLKDAINEALRYWIKHSPNTYYLFGTAAGPHPYPAIVEHFQKIIGEETKRQILKKEGRLPTHIIACVGGGSNALGIFRAFLKKGQPGRPPKVKLIGVEAGGLGLNTKKHGASLEKGRPGCLHGSISYLLQDKYGQIQEAHSIAAGLDYSGVGPKHAYLKETGQAEYVSVTDREALEAFLLLSKLEGIIPALESAHALAYVLKLRPQLKKDDLIVINLSGRGDKDLEQVSKKLASRP